MYSQAADVYDLIYAWKDYAAEAAFIAEVLEREHPKAKTILDVACGTGKHAHFLRSEHGFSVDGIDIEPQFVEIASARNPDGSFSCADMTEFEVERRYDAVLCVFSSIGYLKDLDRVTAALGRFRAHLVPRGVVLVEPWFAPGTLENGRVSVDVGAGEAVHVCRMARTEIVGRTSLLHFEYLIGRPTGIERASEVHELGLFTEAEMRSCFERAGLTCEFDADGLSGRGLYVARVA